MLEEKIEKIKKKDVKMVVGFKVGDKVQIRKDLKIGDGDSHQYTTVIGSMLKHAGKEATIKSVTTNCHGHIVYRLDVDNAFWGWTKEMLKDKTLAKVGDKVRIKKNLVVGDGDDYTTVIDKMLNLNGKKGEVTEVSPNLKGNIRYAVKFKDGNTWYYMPNQVKRLVNKKDIG